MLSARELLGATNSCWVNVDCAFDSVGVATLALTDRLRAPNFCCCFEGGKALYDVMPFEVRLDGISA